MGCTASKDAALFETITFRYPIVLSMLELQQYSLVLMSRFVECDTGGNLHLSFNDYLKFCGVPANRITKRMFQICDADGSGSLDFREASFLIYQLCTLDGKGLTMFLFDIYDEINNNLIEFDDVTRMLEDSYGAENLGEDDIQEFILYTRKKGILKRFEFVSMCERMTQVTRLIMDTQRRVRDTILGSAVWIRLTIARSLKTDALFRPENWSRLMEKIIVSELQSREEQVKRDNDSQLRTGRGINRRGKGGNGAKNQGSIHYEP